MLSLRFIQQNSYDVRLPKPHQTSVIIGLSESFIAYEAMLPPEDRSLYYGKINALVEQIHNQLEDQEAGENQRTIASENVKRLSQQVKRCIDRMIVTVHHHCFDEPSQAQEWGFQIRQKTGNILKPRTRAERQMTLNRYIKKEESRPAEARFTEPSLAEVIDLRDQFQASLAARDAGKAQRQETLAEIKTTAESLYNYLLIALHIIVEQNYEFDVSPGLEKWGFDVVWRRSGTAVNGNSNGASGQVADTEPEESATP